MIGHVRCLNGLRQRPARTDNPTLYLVMGSATQSSKISHNLVNLLRGCRIPRTAMSEAADIVIVSFDRFIHGIDEDKRAVAKQLYNAFSTVGWVYLKDHGIPQERVDETFNLVR